jgi:hypothetical protein
MESSKSRPTEYSAKMQSARARAHGLLVRTDYANEGLFEEHREAAKSRGVSKVHAKYVKMHQSTCTWSFTHGLALAPGTASILTMLDLPKRRSHASFFPRLLTVLEYNPAFQAYQEHLCKHFRCARSAIPTLSLSIVRRLVLVWDGLSACLSYPRASVILYIWTLYLYVELSCRQGRPPPIYGFCTCATPHDAQFNCRLPNEAD